VRKNDYVEKPLVTSGNEILHIATLLEDGAKSYSAVDVIKYLVGTEAARNQCGI
jgi:hypothetical protein